MMPTTPIKKDHLMSNQVPALVINGVLGSTASDDGKTAFLHVKSAANDFMLAIPQDKIVELISTASTAAAACRKILNPDKMEKQVFAVDRWEFGETPDKKGLVLSFRLPGGAEMSFQVHRDRLPQMQEALDMIAGHGPSGPPPGTVRQ
jgi:hypothetical protein